MQPTSSKPGGDSWAAHRRSAAQEHAERLARKQKHEADQALRLVAQFLDRDRRTAPPAQRLRARRMDGKGTARTRLHGWYLKADKSAAIGADGQFYVLLTDSGPIKRLLGQAQVWPSTPPLVLGASGRDGESIPLEQALARISPDHG